MSDLKPLERQIRILQQLALKKEITVDYLYELFERAVSRRTLQRDLQALSSANVPLMERRGEHGRIYWSLDHKYLSFIPMTIGLEEFISSLLLKRLGMIFKNTPIEKDIESLDKKLSQLIPGDVLVARDSLGELEPFFGLLQFGYVDYSEYGEQFRLFLNAALNRRVCEITYRAVNSPNVKRFIIHPYSLLLYRGTFYGIVFQPRHKSYIYILIHRIRKITIRDETFERDSEFQLERFISHAFGVWRKEPELVRVRFLPEIAERITDRVWQPDQRIEKLKDGSIILEIKVAITSELVAWILRWGSFAEVLEPPELIRMVKQEIDILSRRYS